MEKYLQQLLDLAKTIGSIEDVSMGDYVTGQKRIWIAGDTADGKGFALELIVKDEKGKRLEL